jgi:tetratricopeptide (TPR) repeat protein
MAGAPLFDTIAGQTYAGARFDMPAALPYSKQTPGRTFVIAMSVLGLIALTQVGALGWAFVKRAKNPAAGKAASATGKPGPNPGAAASNDKESLNLTDPFLEAGSGNVPGASSAPIMPPSRPQPIAQARLRGGLAPESRFGEILLQGRTLLDRGDTSNALVRFREASALDPRNPEALAEIARTYEKMGLPDKAAEHWKRILDMGESAGVYYTAAEAKMREAVMATRVALQNAEPNGSAGVPAANAMFSIGKVDKENIDDPKALRRFMLRIPIKIRERTKVNVNDLTVQVLFYDRVDDKPQRTSANVEHRFSTAPVDWRDDDTELLEVQYNQPLPDASDPKRENRIYFGYIIRVYYKDELQATGSEPAELGQKFPASQTLEKDVSP